MTQAVLTISSKNYGAWALRGWLMAKLAGLSFDEVMVPIDDANARKEILLLSPSILVPCLTHGDIKVWALDAGNGSRKFQFPLPPPATATPAK